MRMTHRAVRMPMLQVARVVVEALYACCPSTSPCGPYGWMLAYPKGCARLVGQTVVVTNKGPLNVRVVRKPNPQVVALVASEDGGVALVAFLRQVGVVFDKVGVPHVSASARATPASAHLLLRQQAYTAAQARGKSGKLSKAEFATCSVDSIK